MRVLSVIALFAIIRVPTRGRANRDYYTTIVIVSISFLCSSTSIAVYEFPHIHVFYLTCPSAEPPSTHPPPHDPT